MTGERAIELIREKIPEITKIDLVKEDRGCIWIDVWAGDKFANIGIAVSWLHSGGIRFIKRELK